MNELDDYERLLLQRLAELQQQYELAARPLIEELLFIRSRRLPTRVVYTPPAPSHNSAHTS